MADSLSQLALWLADVHLLAGALLAVVLLAMAALRQPAQRMAVAKSTLAALVALVALCALPGWSLVHLLSAEAPPQAAAPVDSIAVAPTFMEPATLLQGGGTPKSARGVVDVENGSPNHHAPRQTLGVPPAAAIDWIATALLVHAIGSAGVIAWLMIGAVMAGRVRRSSGAAPVDVVNALRSIVGDAAVPELLTSSQVATPVALGLRRPAIILPSALSGSGGTAGSSSSGRRVPDSHCWTSQQWHPPVELAAILAHEWAHIASGDLRTLAASRWLLAILWPQPLFWLLRRVIRLDQETLADAAAAEVAGRVDYAEQLVAWARDSGPRGRAPRLAGAVGLWEGPSQLKRRIALLLDEKLTVLRAASRRWRIGTACAALVAACLLSLVTLQRRDVVQASTAKEEESVEVDAPDPAQAIMALDLRVDRQLAEDFGILNTLSPTWGVQGQVVTEPTTLGAAVPDSGDGAFELTELQGELRVLRRAGTDEATATTDAAPIMASTAFALAAAPGTGGGDATAAGTAEGDGETTHSVVGMGNFVAVSAAEQFATGPDANKIGVHCLDAAGAPLAGVSAALYRVKFRAGAHELVAETTSNAAGDVEFAGAVPEDRIAQYKTMAAAAEWNDAMLGTTYLVVLRGEGVATTMLFTQEFEVALRGHRTEVKLGAAQKLAGRVTDAAGNPVAGALVAAGSFASNLVIEGVNAVRTGADGRYEFTDRQQFDAKAAQARAQSQNTFFLAASNAVAAQAPRPDVGVDWQASNLVVSHPDFAVTTQAGGDIPGTVDVVMQPAAVIVGRVVQSASGAPVAGMLVRVMSHPELKASPAGTLLVKPAGGVTPLMPSAHAASTRTGADGRYRIGNLPAGAYDVWAAPNADDPAQAPWRSRGVSMLAVDAGPQAISAPDLVVGPAGVVHGQLVDEETGEAITLGDAGTAAVSLELIGGPRMQDHIQQRGTVSADGKFDFRVPPGKVRAYVLVYSASGQETNQPAYMTGDNVFTTGPVIEVGHGAATDAIVRVWKYETLESQRAARRKAYDLYETDKTKAVAAWTEYLAAYPDEYEGLQGRARGYELIGQGAAAVADLDRVLALWPGDLNAQMHLAGLLATGADADVRDGARAVELATAAVAVLRELGRNDDALLAALNTLAAAYAEAGDFEKAVATQREAIAMVPAEGREKMEARLKLYEAGKPFHRE